MSDPHTSRDRLVYFSLALVALALCAGAWYLHIYALGSTRGGTGPKPSAPAVGPNTVTFDGHTITADPGHDITFKNTVTDRSNGGRELIDRSALGQGASLTATGDKVNTTVDATAPTANAGGGVGATGGNTKLRLDVSKMLDPGAPFFWVGLGGVGVAAYLAFKRHLLSALGALAGGLFFMASSVYPWLLLAGSAATLAVLIYEAYKHGFFREGGRALLSGAKDAGVLEAVVAKAEESHATGTDSAAMATLKHLER